MATAPDRRPSEYDPAPGKPTSAADSQALAAFNGERFARAFTTARTRSTCPTKRVDQAPVVLDRRLRVAGQRLNDILTTRGDSRPSDAGAQSMKPVSVGPTLGHVTDTLSVSALRQSATPFEAWPHLLGVVPRDEHDDCKARSLAIDAVEELHQVLAPVVGREEASRTPCPRRRECPQCGRNSLLAEAQQPARLWVRRAAASQSAKAEEQAQLTAVTESEH